MGLTLPCCGDVLCPVGCLPASLVPPLRCWQQPPPGGGTTKKVPRRCQEPPLPGGKKCSHLNPPRFVPCAPTIPSRKAKEQRLSVRQVCLPLLKDFYSTRKQSVGREVKVKQKQAPPKSHRVSYLKSSANINYLAMDLILIP